jgi:hypothetical protein
MVKLYLVVMMPIQKFLWEILMMVDSLRYGMGSDIVLSERPYLQIKKIFICA